MLLTESASLVGFGLDLAVLKWSWLESVEVVVFVLEVVLLLTEHVHRDSSFLSVEVGLWGFNWWWGAANWHALSSRVVLKGCTGALHHITSRTH